jgi:hypothetical protein
MKKIIAIAGHAHSGKDRLYSILENYYSSQNLKTQRFAFADELKREVDEFLISKTGISAWTSDPVQKAVIRPFLVFWGTEFRRNKNQDHWIECLAHNPAWTESDADVLVITDLRFSNEYEWLKQKGGSSIYLSRLQDDGSPVPAPNEYERVNNAWLQTQADIDFVWPTCNDAQELETFTLKNLIPQL